MRRCVDFALQDLLGALDREGRDVAAQRFTRLGHLLFSVGLGGSDDTRCFFGGCLLGVFDNALRALLGVADALLAFIACAGQFSLHTFLGSGHLGLAAICGSQAFRNLLGALV